MIRWFIKTVATIIVGFIACIVIFCCVGCDASLIVPADEQTLAQYLNGFQQFEFECLITNFNILNDGDTIYWMWNNSSITNDEVEERNKAYSDDGIVAIFVDVCRDGSLYVNSSLGAAYSIAAELNALNTNSFSRAMFFVDAVALEIYGHTVTTYNPDKDVFQ